MVDILSAVLTDGLTTVEAACGEALSDGVQSSAVILNISWPAAGRPPRRDRSSPPPPCACNMNRPPIAPGMTACGVRPMERHEVLEMMTELKLGGMRAAFDEVIADGLKRQHPVQRIVGDLLRAEIAEKIGRAHV